MVVRCMTPSMNVKVVMNVLASNDKRSSLKGEAKNGEQETKMK